MSRARSILLGWLVVLAVLATVIAIPTVVLPRYRQHRAEADLLAATRSGYATVVPAWDEERRLDDQILAEALGRPSHRSRVVRCYLDESYAGLMVQGWTQVCQVRTVDLHPTSASYAALSRRITGAVRRHPGHRLGTKATEKPTAGCGPLRGSFSAAPTRNSVVVTRLAAGRFTRSIVDQPCMLPVPDDPDWPGVRRVESSFDATAIADDRSWVAVVGEVEFVRDDLGCAGWVFCDAPVRGPVLP